MAWLTGYGFRKRITITGSAAGAQTNYQMKLTVHKGAGADSGGDVYLDGQCQDDFDDIRFTESDGSTELHHWRESYVFGTSAVFWIEFDAIPINPNTANFYIYFDNSGASSGSNGADTFLFFDDFPSLDTGKWDDRVGTPQVAGGLLVLGADPDRVRASGSSWLYDVKTRARIKVATTNDVGRSGLSNQPVSQLMYIDDCAYIFFYLEDIYSSCNDEGLNGITSIVSGFAAETFYIFSTHWKSGEVKQYVNDTLEITELTGVPNETMYSRIDGDTGVVSVDWYLVAKYCDPEPTWTSWGSREVPLIGKSASMGAKMIAGKLI